MPVTDIVIVGFVILFFVVFAGALAWGDHQTSDIARESRRRALGGVQAASHKQGAAAESGKAPAGEKAKAATPAAS